MYVVVPADVPHDVAMGPDEWAHMAALVEARGKRNPRGNVVITHGFSVIDGTEYLFSNLSHAVPVLRELGVRVSASRLYNEYRDQVERAHVLPVTSRTVVIWPRVSVSKV